MTFFDLAKERYSERKFSDKAVGKELLDAILETGRIAPTAHNNQPQRIKVLTAAGDLAKVDECTPCRYGAPVVFMVCYDKDVSWKRGFDGEDGGVVDASIVTTHLMLAAQEKGIASCWVMHFDPAKAISLFDLPKNIVPVALLPVGYPAEGSGPSPRHTDRLLLDSILF